MNFSEKVVKIPFQPVECHAKKYFPVDTNAQKVVIKEIVLNAKLL
jgi:hypothetical protein